jgi:hypothetical protein
VPERPTIAELVIAGSPEPWEGLGFEVTGGRFRAGAVRVRLADDAEASGILGWSLRAVATPELVGVPTTVSTEALPDEPAPPHANGCRQIDHVVVLTSDLERTTDALAEAGIERRRVREAGAVRQGFFRLGEVILEVVAGVDGGPANGEPARFWGLVFVVDDIDAAKALLGDRLGSVRDAVQPGRRIVTVREHAGLGVPVALITPGARQG